MADINQVGQTALAGAPSPIRRLLAGINPQFSLETGKTQGIGTQPKGGKEFAGVEDGSPNQIKVTDPAKFMQSPRQAAAHEAVHIIHNNMSPQQQAQIAPDKGVDPTIALNPAYLAQQRAAGKSILQLPKEEQAYLVQNYTAQQEAAEKGYITPQQMQQVEQTYGPWIQDFNKAQLSNIMPTQPDSNTLNTTPRAPMPPINLQQDAVQFAPQQGGAVQSLLAGMNQPQQPAPQYVPPVVANTNKWANVVQGALAGLGGGLKAGMQNVQDAGTPQGPHANGYAQGAQASQDLQDRAKLQQQQATQQAQQDYENKMKSAQFGQEQQLQRARTMEANLHLLGLAKKMDDAPKEAQDAYYKGQDAHEKELRKEGMSSLGEVGDLNSASQWMQENKKNTADVVFTHHQDSDGKDRIAIWENPSHSVDAGSINARLHNKADHVNPGTTMNAGDAYSFVNGRNSKYSDQQQAQALQSQRDAASMQRTQVQQSGENARQQKTQNAKSLSGSPGGDALADEIGQGKMAPERISYLLTRNPDLMKAVADKYPDFDSSKVASYAKTYQDFTSGKTATALNSVGTSLEHLQDLKALNTLQSHIPGTPDYNAYKAQIEPLAEEMSKFYGGGVGSVASTNSFKKALDSQLPGTRDAAIKTAAKALGVKLDNYDTQWKNAAPSKTYQQPMPGISDQARSARAALDPTYKGAGSGPPKGATHIVPGSDGKMHYTDGKNDLGVAQ